MQSVYLFEHTWVQSPCHLLFVLLSVDVFHCVLFFHVYMIEGNINGALVIAYQN